MRINPTWQQIGLVAVLLTSVIVAHLFAPLAISVVTSIASTLIGVFFVNVNGPAQPTLTVVRAPPKGPSVVAPKDGGT
jgi:hypothetical protein